MKRITFILIIVISGITSCNNKPKTDTGESLNTDYKSITFAKELSNKILSAQKRGSFYNLSEEEANIKMKSGLSESVQKTAYNQIKKSFGDYKGLEFENSSEILHGEKYKIYRFKGDFESSSKVEIRTVLDSNGKLAGFFVLPWNDSL